MMKHRGILIVVSGFSGAGKGTLMKELINTYDNYALSVSMTTRKPRAGEEEGKSYFFVDRETFERTIEMDGLIEYACYCDNYYGTPREYVEACLDNGRDVILEIEIQGALKVKDKFPETLLLFIMPPSAKELRRRLEGRGTESEEIICQRISRAAEEAEGIENYDYIIINDKLDDCVKEMHGIINAARRSPQRNKELIADMRSELDALVKGE
jgi:guanylate kinase